MDTVKGSLEVDKIEMQRRLPFYAFFYDVSNHKYLIGTCPSFTEACCSFIRFFSSVCLILVRIIWVNTFDTIDSKVIPLQLLHYVRSPLLTIFTIRHLCQSVGIFSFCQMCPNIQNSKSVVISILALSNSTGISSKPGALLFFSHA